MVNKNVLCTIAVTSLCVRQQRKRQPLRLNSRFTLIHFRPPCYKKNTVINRTHSQEKINIYGACKRRTRNTQTVCPIICWGMIRAPGSKILKRTFPFQKTPIIKTLQMLSTKQVSSSATLAYYCCMIFGVWKMFQNPCSSPQK